MINFHNIFNSFRMGGGNSSINDLIDEPNTNIDRLLDEESFVNEIKSNNSKVNEYMKYDKYQTLVEYVTKVGPEDDRKRSYKYPLSSCDVLSSDSQAPIQFFFPEKPLIITEKVEEEVKKEIQPIKPNIEQASDQTKITSVEKIEVIEQESQSSEVKQDHQKQGQIQNQGESEQKNAENNQSEMNGQTESQAEAQKQEKQNEVKTIQRQVEPLSNKLFSYFEGEVNYTLAGYVSKIFGSFLTKKPQLVLPYLLKERFPTILNHIQSRSVSELVIKILTHESNECLEERRIAFDQMLEKASKSAEVYIFSNLSASVCQVIEKVAAGLKAISNESAQKLSQLYFKSEIITKVITNVMSDEENVSVYNAPILLTYLTNVPLILPQNEEMLEDLKNLLELFVSKALEKLKISRQSRSSLGFGRVKIVEIMCFVLKQNILGCQDIAANQPEFFTTLFKLCQNYQLNNVLHNEVVKIVQIALSQTETSPFLQKLLNQQVLLGFLKEETEEDMRIRAGEGSQKTRKGYIGHIVQICRKLQQYAEKNHEIQNFIDQSEFDFILQNLVNKEVYQTNKTLAGYGMNKSNKNTILFMKEDVIQEHLKFLMETPPSIYETEKPEEHINIEHPGLVEAEHQQMESPTLSDLIQGQIDEQQKEQDKVDAKYWNKHIEYNVEDLMNDL